MTSDPIARAIEAMLEERATLAARIALLDDVIERTRSVLGVSAPLEFARVKPKPPVKPVIAPKGDNTVADDTARRVLSQGPMRPSEFSKALKLDVVRARGIVQDLAARGVVVVSGITNGRRISLPTKEVP